MHRPVRNRPPSRRLSAAIIVTSALVAAAASSPAVAEGNWSLRVSAVELERRLGRRWGLEVATLSADLDARFDLDLGIQALADTETSSFELWSLGVNYHLTPERATDVHVGVFAAITYFDDLVFLTEAGRADKLVFDDDVGFGVKLGVDHPLGDSGRWWLTAGVRYLRVILEGEIAGQDGDLDPVIGTVGVGYRF